MRLQVAAALALAFVVGLLAGFLAQSLAGGGAGSLESVCPGYGLLERVKERGKLVVGTSADWPPYEYVLPNGSFAGIDIELAKRIAGRLGVELEIRDMKFAALFEAVRRGDVDLAIADIAMKPERFEAVDFTIPYRCETGKAIIVRAEDAGKYTGYGWLEGKKIGVQLGTTEQDLAERYFGGKAEVVTFGKVYPEMVMALKTERVDAIIVAPDVAEALLSKEQGLKVVDQLPFFSCSAVAVPHCAYGLKEEVSKVIWDLLQSGELKKIIEDETAKWLAGG
ncbi:MAG: ABC transporter substrate-binding protein [Thermoproteota archaeon]